MACAARRRRGPSLLPHGILCQRSDARSAPLLSPSARGFQAIPLLQRPPPRQPIVPVLGRPPRVHLWHIGCQMNDADHEMLAERFAEIGFVPDAALDDADLAVLITCAVRQNAEQKVYGKFRELTEWKQARARAGPSP